MACTFYAAVRIIAKDILFSYDTTIYTNLYCFYSISAAHLVNPFPAIYLI